jgi:CelD/BcsL family acetyltransferase involved in cellulose biosynthesis
MRRPDWLTRALTVVALTGAALVLASVETPIRGTAAALVLLVAPGVATALLLGEMPWQTKLAIAVAATVVLDVAVAQAMIVSGAWSPRGGVVAVALVSGGLLASGLARSPAAGRAGHPVALPGGDADGTAALGAPATAPMGVLPAPPPDGLVVEVVRPTDLGDAEVERWRELQRGAPGLRNPFLAPEFAQAVGRIHDNARVAVLSEGADIVGFFPFDRYRFGIGRPIAAGLTDCQGIVHAPGLPLEATTLLRDCGLSVFEFDHLVDGQTVFEPYTTARAASPIIDLADGYAAYEAQLRKNSSKFLRTTRSKARKLGREVGDLRFDDDTRDREALRQLMSWKSDQYRRTGRTDRFAQPWIVELVEHLLDTDGPTFAGALSMLYAGDRPIAGHFGLRSETILVGWFPAYDVGFAKFSPGLIQHLRMAEAAAAAGIQHIDLGRGDREYKDSLKSRELTVAEGRALRPSPTAAAYWSVRATTRAARNVVLGNPRLYRAADRALKRYGRITSALSSRPETLSPRPQVSGGDDRDGDDRDGDDRDGDGHDHIDRGTVEAGS